MSSDISTFHSDGMRAFGFFSERFSSPSAQPPEGGTVLNVLQISSYVPGVGSLLGLRKICAVIDCRWKSEETPSYNKAVLFRGMAEFLGPCGALLLGHEVAESFLFPPLLLIGIPDLIVTIGRAMNPHPNSTWGKRVLAQKV